jgi:hypothetical protein
MMRDAKGKWSGECRLPKPSSAALAHAVLRIRLGDMEDDEHPDLVVAGTDQLLHGAHLADEHGVIDVAASITGSSA